LEFPAASVERIHQLINLSLQGAHVRRGVPLLRCEDPINHISSRVFRERLAAWGRCQPFQHDSGDFARSEDLFRVENLYAHELFPFPNVQGYLLVQAHRAADDAGIAAEVSLRRMGKGAYQCRLFDLSPEGCKAEMIERPRVGERAVIRLPGIEPLEAEVRWVEGPNAGLRFERSFHPAVFEMLLARLG